MSETKSVFQTLRELDMTYKHKEKNKLTYLPWASAWAAVKTIYPNATYDIVRSPDGNLYWTDGKTCRVETRVTIEGLTQGETLAVMDHRNQSIPFDTVTSTAVDKSIKRCLTKNLGLFGLDLNLWEGEEISDEVKGERKKKKEEDEAEAKKLEAAKTKVIELGTKLMSQGVAKAAILECVAKHNNDNGNPASIESIEVAEAVCKDFESQLKKLTK